MKTANPTPSPLIRATRSDVNVNVKGNGTTTFTAPIKPGTYPYHCNFHGNMKGTLTVK
jgi:plastocyanin